MGEINVTTGNQTLPGKRCRGVWFKTPKGNTGKVYIGWGSATVPDGTTNETAGYELGKDQALGPIRASNLDMFAVIGTDADDSLIYFTES